VNDLLSLLGVRGDGQPRGVDFCGFVIIRIRNTNFQYTNLCHFFYSLRRNIMHVTVETIASSFGMKTVFVRLFPRFWRPVTS